MIVSVLVTPQLPTFHFQKIFLKTKLKSDEVLKKNRWVGKEILI